MLNRGILTKTHSFRLRLRSVFPRTLPLLETDIGSGDNSMCDGEAVGGIVDGCDVDDCGTVGGRVTEGRAVDELCSTFGMNGASVGSGDVNCWCFCM